MGPLFRKMFYGLGILCIGHGWGEIQPYKFSPHSEHVVELDGGSSSIFNNGFSEADFIANVYALQSDAPNYMTWSQGHPFGRCFGFNPVSSGNRSSVTWHFKAPNNYVFTGGRMLFRAEAKVKGTKISVYAHGDYSYNAEPNDNPDAEFGGYKNKDPNNVLYASDTRVCDRFTGTSEYSDPTNWIVEVPKGKSEFFLTVNAFAANSPVFGISLLAQNIQILPADWSLATKDPENKIATFSFQNPVNIRILNGSTSPFELNRPAQAVTAGEVWTLSLAAATVNPGWMLPEPNKIMGLKAYFQNTAGCESEFDAMDLSGDSKAQVFGILKDIQGPQPPLPWHVKAMTVRVPSTLRDHGCAGDQPVTKMHFAFTGEGGGELYIASVREEKSENWQASTDLPPNFPPRWDYPVKIPVSADKEHRLVSKNTGITFTVCGGCKRTDVVDYQILDAYGRQAAGGSGQVALGQQVSFTPNENGFYELLLSGTVAGKGYPSGTSSMAVMPSYSDWSWGSNPFGMLEADDGLMQRAGWTWKRPLMGNLLAKKEGSPEFDPHNYLEKWPDDIEGYAAEYRNKLSTCPGLPAAFVGTMEIWNEPENNIFTKPRSSPYNPSSETTKCPEKGTKDYVAVKDFVELARRASSSIQSVNNYLGTTTRFAVDFSDPNRFSDFNNCGGSDLYQIASLHPYSQKLIVPEDPIKKQNKYSSSPEADGLIGVLKNYRNSINSTESTVQKEFWSTEFGWPTQADKSWSTTELNQARYVVRSALIQLASGLKRVMPLSLNDEPENFKAFYGYFGLRHIDGTPKPAFVGYSILANKIRDLQYQGRFKVAGNNVAFLFSKGANSVLVLWSPDEKASLNLQFSGKSATGTGMLGEDLGTMTGFNGVPGRSPIYLQFQGDALSTMLAIQYPSRNVIPFEPSLGDDFFSNVKDNPYDK